MQELFFSQGTIKTGSVYDYYKDVSNGMLEVEGVVVGPYTMPLTLKQYANGESGTGNAYPNGGTMALHAAQAANVDVDFSQFDNAGNDRMVVSPADSSFDGYAGLPAAAGFVFKHVNMCSFWGVGGCGASMSKYACMHVRTPSFCCTFSHPCHSRTWLYLNEGVAMWGCCVPSVIMQITFLKPTIVHNFLRCCSVSHGTVVLLT